METNSANQISPDSTNEDVFKYEVSDDSLERVADVERLGAVTLVFCGGLDTCPS
jgi:hypothetical protein